MKLKSRSNMYAAIIILVPVILYIYVINANTAPDHNGDFHFYYVIFSSIIALFVGLAAFLEFKKSGIVKIFYISVGFIGVGVFYTYHALVTPGMQLMQIFSFNTAAEHISVFVLFGDLSRLWLAIMMFLPDSLFAHNDKMKRLFNGYTLIIFTVLLAGMVYYGLLRPEFLPRFKHEDLTDTYLAILTKVVTLLFIGINALKYYYSYKAKPNITILSFIVGLVLIMETSLLFMISKPWNSVWWLAHNVFLMSYVVIGFGVVYSYLNKEKYEFFDVVGQMHRYTRMLEEKNIELNRLANYDVLTGLSNRRFFISTTEQYLKKAEKEKIKFSMLFVDLDHFKTVNDKFGHKVGDELLKICALRLTSVIKSSDIASRIGGDEFILLVKNVDRIQVEIIAQRIIETLSEPIVIDEHICNIGASIGISLYPHDGLILDELISKSDAAMYNVKNDGRNNYKLAF